MNFLSKLFGPATPELDAAEVNARLDGTTGPLVLDVREPHEFTGGHIPGARLMPLGTLPQRMKELPRDREIICVCHSGNRSGSAARHLSSAGFKAINLRGGMIAWSRAGLRVRKGGK